MNTSERPSAAHSHGHAPCDAGNRRRVGWAAALTATFMLAEVAGGLLSGSLALLADAGHMLTDAAALVLAWFAFRIARRPSDWQRTYGFHRFQVLAAYTRSEEHTSELQSLRHLVCRLLLEKK